MAVNEKILRSTIVDFDFLHTIPSIQDASNPGKYIHLSIITMTPLKTNILLLATLCFKLATAQPNEDIVIPSSLPGCTSTITLTQSRLSTPPFWQQCSWDGTMTVYPSTVTIDAPVDCHGCTDVRVTAVPMVHCPAMIISTVVHVATPSTSYRTVCAVTPTPTA